MRNLQRLAALFALVVASLAAAPLGAVPTNTWMTEEAMRAAFIGKTLDGHYVDGLRWTESYGTDGRLDYRETERSGLGRWYFRGNIFCTFYDPGQGLNGGCWTVVRAGANCYEFYIAGIADAQSEDEAAPGPLGAWAARAWRQGEASTCQDKPSV